MNDNVQVNIICDEPINLCYLLILDGYNFYIYQINENKRLFQFY